MNEQEMIDEYLHQIYECKLEPDKLYILAERAEAMRTKFTEALQRQRQGCADVIRGPLGGQLTDAELAMVKRILNAPPSAPPKGE